MASEMWEETGGNIRSGRRDSVQDYCPISGLAGAGMLWRCLDPCLALSPHGEGKVITPGSLKAAQGQLGAMEGQSPAWALLLLKIGSSRLLGPILAPEEEQ